MEKVVLHYDLDAFYASIEIRDNPKLKGKPIAVGKGVVTTASYEARKFGIHSAMSMNIAKKLCPNLITVWGNKEKYSQESKIIHDLVLKLTHKIEFIALDEGYIDISDIIANFSSKEKFAEIFRKRIYSITGLTCSVGIGYNKLTAKIASDINKPFGQFIFESEKDYMEYIKDKGIRKLQGVGKQFEKLLNKDGIFIVGDLFKLSLKELSYKYGKSRGELIYLSSRGIDYREIKYNKPTHSIGNETTYSFPLEYDSDILSKFYEVFEVSYVRLLKKDFLVKTLAIKIRYDDMETVSKAKTLSQATSNKENLKTVLEELVSSINFNKNIRLLGVTFKNLVKKSSRQLTFNEF